MSQAKVGSQPITVAVTPKAVDDQLFDFPLPPRLQSIGRKISQMSQDLLSDDMSARPVKAPIPEPKGGIPEEVPGMGEEPVVCPYCSKPLPPSLFSVQSHNHRVKLPPKIARSHSVTEGRRENKSLFGFTDLTDAKADPKSGGRSGAATPVEKQTISGFTAAPKQLLDPLPVQPSTSSDPAATAQLLLATVTTAEAANHNAADVSINDADLRRWSRIAGLSLDPPPLPRSAPEKPIPLLAPPPGANKLVKTVSADSEASATSFIFFRPPSSAKSGDDEDESDEEPGGGNGYKKLVAPGSPSDDEEAVQRVKVAEPEEILQEEETVTMATIPEIADASVTPETGKKGDDEIRAVLSEVLVKINAVSKSHTDLLNSQSSLLTSLKIARSNLTMAEANSEMLESQLKRVTSAGSQTVSGSRGNPSARPKTPITQPTPVTPVVRQNPASTGSRNTSEQPRSTTTPSTTQRPTAKTRPMSLQMPPPNFSAAGPQSAQIDGKSAWGGFWNGGKKQFDKMQTSLDKVQLSAQQVMAQIPVSLPSTPRSENKTIDFGQLMSVAPSSAIGGPLPIDTPRSPLTRSNTTTSPTTFTRPASAASASSSSAPSQPSVGLELYKLRQAFVSAQKKMEVMAVELAELKTGKVAMEAELEGLSQALFEEANKMVSDERRARAELEESLKEVKAEREVLRETIKVLGGQIEDGPPALKGAGETPEVKPKDDVFHPRDLDKHYEALRKTIHHVGDARGAEALAEATANPLLNPVSRPLAEIPEDAALPRTSMDTLVDASNRSSGASEGNSAKPDFEPTSTSTSAYAPTPNARAETNNPFSVPLSPNPWASNSMPNLNSGMSLGLADRPTGFSFGDVVRPKDGLGYGLGVNAGGTGGDISPGTTESVVSLETTDGEGR